MLRARAHILITNCMLCVPKLEAAKMKQLLERGDAARYHGQIGRSQTHYTVEDYPLMQRVFAENLWPILQETAFSAAVALAFRLYED